MSSTNSEDDPSFVALSARLRHRIDDAFDSIVPQSGPSQSREYEPGGFILEDPSQSQIPLSEIPRALQYLYLLPDDEIMGVFKNAATGWGAQNAYNDGVSRKDWRAVCAALLEGEHVDGSDEEDLAGTDSDEYQISEEDSNDDVERPGRTVADTTQNIPQQTQLTASQKAQCRQDFGRFFPDVSDDELDEQRIMIKDVARVANVLKENLTTEQILDMLEAFSTSPDKSMTLADFEHMMLLAKLI